MSSKNKSGSSTGKDIPLYYHTRVLGVDIGVAPVETANYPHVDIHVYPDHVHWGPGVYRELCDWIRRNELHK